MESMDEAVSSWEGFSSWVQGICIVTFDLELGQAIEEVYPPGLYLSDKDKINICYLAFPDSNSGVMGDSQFHFRIRTDVSDGRRKVNNEEDATSPSSNNFLPDQVSRLSLDNYNAKTPSGIQFDPNYLFGFVYFRQTKDPNIRRGYYQKSLILLSRLPLISLFGQITNVLARRYFESGGSRSTLEEASKDMNAWPAPNPGSSHSLPFLGLLFTSFLPSTSIRSSEFGTETVSLEESSHLASFASPDLFTVLCPVLEHMHTLWELVLTGEPLVIMAGGPSLVSAAVQHLTSIIHPLAYCADYRPFYTIHDSDFKDITGSNSNALPNILLGVTNPFFSKALSHWPHIVKLGDGNHLSTGLNGSTTSPRQSIAAHNKQVKKVSKFKLDSKPGLYSSNKPLLEKDKAIIKKIQKGLAMKRPPDVQSALIRRHFLELTQTFMIPLERYMSSLMPLAKNISPYRSAPKVKSFIPDDFFRSLEKFGPQLTSSIKGDWEALYRRFFRSPNFVGWYNHRNKEVASKLECLHLESLSESKIEHWISGKEEVQLVDMVLRIRKKLGDKALLLPDIVRERLDLHVEAIIKALPPDLKPVLQDKGP